MRGSIQRVLAKVIVLWMTRSYLYPTTQLLLLLGRESSPDDPDDGHSWSSPESEVKGETSQSTPGCARELLYAMDTLGRNKDQMRSNRVDPRSNRGADHEQRHN
jgi:hypothetical protein